MTEKPAVSTGGFLISKNVARLCGETRGGAITLSDDPIEAYVDSLVKQRHPNGTPENLAAMREEASERVEHLVNVAIYEKIPLSQRGAFEDALDRGTQEEITAFINQHVPDMNGLVLGVLKAYRVEYLEGDA